MLATLLIWLSVAVAVLALADLFLSQAQKTWLSDALIKTWSVLDEAKSWSFADWLKKPSSLLKIPRQNESSLIQFFYHESVEARMRGAFTDQGQLFSYISPEARVRT